MGDAEVGGELALERLDLGAEDVLAVHHARRGGVQALAQGLERGPSIEEWDRHRPLP